MATLRTPITAYDHIAGTVDAPVTLVEYGDFECPHCGRAYPIVEAVRRDLGPQLRFVYRHFPLTEIHPHAFSAAEASESAAAAGRFWEMEGLLFRNQKAQDLPSLLAYAEKVGVDPKQVALDLESGVHAERVRADFRGGVRSGVNGTPTFFINGVRYDDDWSDLDLFQSVLLQAAGLAV